MKKSQIFMTVAAFAFAAAGAIASNAGAQATTGWKYDDDNEACLGVSASCPGGSMNCILGTGDLVYKDINCTIVAKRN